MVLMPIILGPLSSGNTSSVMVSVSYFGKKHVIRYKWCNHNNMKESKYHCVSNTLAERETYSTFYCISLSWQLAQKRWWKEINSIISQNILFTLTQNLCSYLLSSYSGIMRYLKSSKPWWGGGLIFDTPRRVYVKTKSNDKYTSHRFWALLHHVF